MSSKIDEIHFEEDGIRIWTTVSDEFFIHEKDFPKVRKALREFKKKDRESILPYYVQDNEDSNEEKN